MNTEPTPRVRPRQGDFFGLRKCDSSELSAGYGEASKMTPMFCQDGYGLDVLPAPLGWNPSGFIICPFPFKRQKFRNGSNRTKIRLEGPALRFLLNFSPKFIKLFPKFRLSFKVLSHQSVALRRGGMRDIRKYI